MMAKNKYILIALLCLIGVVVFITLDESMSSCLTVRFFDFQNIGVVYHKNTLKTLVF
jgi:hypothetical protein